MTLEYADDFELVPRAFSISPGVVIPIGRYDTGTVRASYNLGQQRRVSGRTSTAFGSFYDGRRTDLTYAGRLTIVREVAVEPGLTVNWVRLPYGDFTARLVSVRLIVTPTPRLGVSSLVQYNAIPHSLSASIRLRWEYRPGSELFIVYSEGRDTLPSLLVPGLQNRSLALKVTRMLRF